MGERFSRVPGSPRKREPGSSLTHFRGAGTEAVWPQAGKMVVTRSARSQAGIQAPAPESPGQKVGNSKAPSSARRFAEWRQVGGAARGFRSVTGSGGPRAEHGARCCVPGPAWSLPLPRRPLCSLEGGA